jgi:hypothetical protein
VLPSTLGYQRSTWAGNPANPYDTTRSASLGSSSGSGVSVSANLVMASLGEETRASCRGPSNHNAIALILPHKAMLGFDGGAIGADIYCDRAGIHARKVGDCAKILDALKDPSGLLRSARSVHHGAALVGAAVLCGPRQGVRRAGALKGMRLGVIRESMVYPKGSKTEQPIVDAATKEIKTCSAAARRDAGGVRRSAVDARPGVEQMTVDFRRRWRGSCRCSCRTCCSGVKADGTPVFPDFAAAIVPTEFAPAKSSARARCSRSTIASRWPKAGSRRRAISISPPSRTRRWRWHSASISRST